MILCLLPFWFFFFVTTKFPMAIPRFYCPTPLTAHSTITLPSDLAHHAIRVLRLKPDSDIVLFDGTGGQYAARLLVEGKSGYAAIAEHDPVEAELSGQITLVQGIAAGEKMDWVIEKATELGAYKVVPITAQRSVLQLRGDRLEKRLLHWQRVALAASEQCGRNRIMQVDPPYSLAAWLESQMPDNTTTLLCHPDSHLTLPEALKPMRTDSLSILVGPEGGWSEQELMLAERHKALKVQFGRRVLRTETAGIALISAISALCGWN